MVRGRERVGEGTREKGRGKKKREKRRGKKVK